MHSTQTNGRLARLADLTFRRRGRTVLAWIVVLAAVVGLTPFVAGGFDGEFGTPGSDSEAASDLIAERFPGTSGDAIDVVWQAPGGVGAPSVEATMERFLARASELEGVGEPSPPRVSQDGAIALARLELDRPSLDVPTSTGERLIELAEATSGAGLRVELGGGPIREAQGGASPEAVGLIAAAAILLIAFGSVVAAGLPLLVALFGLGISASLIGVVAAVMDVPAFAPAGRA
jgi:RND superfamily putative drug exporter